LACERFLFTRSRLFEIAETIDEKLEIDELSAPILETTDITKNILCQLDNGEAFEDEFQMRLYLNLMDIK
jgi:hypothetical protein